MGSDNIDNEKLLSEIESLEDDSETITKDNKSVKKAWLKVLGLVVLLGLCTLYFGEGYYYDDIQDDSYEESIEEYETRELEIKNKFKEQQSKIIIKDSFLNFNKELIATVENNNNEAITDLNIEVIFYNGENKPIEIDSTVVGIVEKNSKYYVKFYETPEEFERYEFLVSKDYYLYDNEDIVTDQISYEVVENKEEAKIVVKNNSSKEISEVDFQILYYDKENNVIDVEYVSLYEIKKKRTQTETMYLEIFDKKTYDAVEYEKYEVNLLGAYIY